MIPAVLAICALMFVLTVNFVVVSSVKGDVDENFPDGTEACAVVLGAKVHEGGRLSDMLRDRMDTAISLYESGKVGKLLLSGDGRGEWSEVKYMKLYAMESGVREEDILEDPEGYSTYETMQRAKMYLDKLAQGIDPITNQEVPEDSVLNHVRLARCFFYVSNVLQDVINNGGVVGKTIKPQKISFSITDCKYSIS